MAYQAPHDAVTTPHLDSQQTNGVVTSPMPIEMQAPPPSYAGQAQGQNEKGQPQPQQPIYSNGVPPQQGQGGPARNYYSAATPLASLQSNPQPIDCPFCGVRELTK